LFAELERSHLTLANEHPLNVRLLQTSDL